MIHIDVEFTCVRRFAAHFCNSASLSVRVCLLKCAATHVCACVYLWQWPFLNKQIHVSYFSMKIASFCVKYNTHSGVQSSSHHHHTWPALSQTAVLSSYNFTMNNSSAQTWLESMNTNGFVMLATVVPILSSVLSVRCVFLILINMM